MISREELAAALKRLDPRDWEVLDLSLRRRVPDEALAKVFEAEPAEIARRRAAAIEHLADALGVQRGEDLGAVLKALLDSETWDAADGGDGFQAFEGPGREPEPERKTEPKPEALPREETPPSEPRELKTSEAARLFRLTPAPDPIDEPGPDGGEGREPRGPGPERTAPAYPHPVAAPAQRPAAEQPGDAAAAQQRTDAPAVEQSGEAADAKQSPDEAAVEQSADAQAAEQPADAPAAEQSGDAPAAEQPADAPATAEQPGDAPPARPEPVFAPRNGGGDSEPVLEMLAERDQEKRGGARFRSPVLYVVAGGLGAAGLLAAGWFGATQFDEGSGERSTSDGEQGPRRFLPEQGGPLAAPFPSDPKAASCYSTAYVRRPTVVYSRPGGRRKLKLPATTEWGSPRVLSVVRRRGDWLAVLAPELKNGEVGWMEASGAARIDCVRWSLHVDLSRRRLYVRRDGRTVRRMSVAIGSRRHPTPKGRFAVTDKLRVTDKGSPYGCCVLALTGHQTKLPADWPGGDRLAVHATSDLSSIGKPVSLGCMRSSPRRVSWLIKQVPLGSPMFIRA